VVATNHVYICHGGTPAACSSAINGCSSSRVAPSTVNWNAGFTVCFWWDTVKIRWSARWRDTHVRVLDANRPGTRP
jgi:hypothetical protein